MSNMEGLYLKIPLPSVLIPIVGVAGMYLLGMLSIKSHHLW